MAKPLKILLVDDDENFCKSLSMVLAEKGYSMVNVFDGLAAIEEVRKTDFDFVFMDIKMPVMNGVETFKEIKKIRPDATVIMMTAYSVEELIREALEEGAFDVLHKPLDIDNVLNIIKNAKSEQNGRLILIIDDDETISSSLSQIFEEKGFKTKVAAKAEDAFEIAKSNDIDIVLIDMKLPTLNGLETYLELRKLKPEIIAIMMTAYPQETNQLVQQAIESTAYTCIYKPFSMNKLLNLLSRAEKNSKKPGINNGF